MIANFFKKTKPIHAILISVLFFLFFLIAIFVIEQPNFSFLLLLNKFGSLLGFLALFFIIRFINRKNQLSGQDSYVMLILALLFAMFPWTMNVNEVALSHFFLLFSFRRIYSMRSLKNIKQKAYDSGFWIGVASLFYMWSTVFSLLILIAIFVYKRQEIRSVVIAIIGFITPLFLVFTYYFLRDDSDAFFEKFIFEYSFSFENLSSFQYLIPIGFALIFVLGAMAFVRLKINSLPNDLKPSWIVLVSHLFLAIYVILLSPEKNGSEFIFAFFPIAIFSANLMQLIQHKILKEVFIYAFGIVVISVYFLQFITIG